MTTIVVKLNYGKRLLNKLQGTRYKIQGTRYKVQDTRYKIQEMRLNYIEKGKGETTLLFLHYFGGAANSWNEVINGLQNEFHCIAVDLLGFGKTQLPNAPLSVEENANAVVELIAECQLTNYIVIGHSMGGKIALAVAAKQPEGLLRLVLIAPSPPATEPMSDKERTEMDEAFGKKEKVEAMLGKAIATPLAAAIFEREVANNLCVAEAAWHWWPSAGSKEDISIQMPLIQVPVSILGGEKDKRFTKQFLKTEFEKYFVHFSLVEIRNSGHLLPVEAPEEVVNAIRFQQ